METFYLVGFEGDCSTYYFHSKEKAKNFIWDAYCDDYPHDTDTEWGQNDHNNLIENDFIDGYAWISEENFEDE